MTSFSLSFGLTATFSSDPGERGALRKGDVVFMVQILPFCGWRYDLSQVGSLSEVTAPTSRLINESVQHALYRKHPCNVVRLVMNREEPGDLSPADRTARADDFLRLWKREGILLLEHDTAFYIVETTFRLEEIERTRWSVIARLRLPDAFPEVSDDLRSIVQADPETVSYELELRTVCQASLSPVTALLEDTTGEDSDPRSLSDHLEVLVRQLTPIECIDEEGVRHRMWPLTDEVAKTELKSRLSCFSVCIVGGAAEIAAAVRFRADLLATGTVLDPNDPAHTVLACLIPTDDLGLQFLPHVLNDIHNSTGVGPETIEPSLTPAEVFSFAERGQRLAQEALRLYPDIPTGLVFSAFES